MIDVVVSPLLSKVPGLHHAFFTRNGGVSEAPYDSLNVGLGSRDHPERVRENRLRAAASLGLPADRLVTVYQVHSSRSVAVHAPWDGAPPEADAMVSAAPDLAIGVLTADCAPILLVDPEARVVGAAHAGWRGALGGVVEAVVGCMADCGAQRGRIIAAVGPCIAQASYEVGLEFEARFLSAAASHAAFFAPGPTMDKRCFDLPGFVLDRLALAGIENAESLGRDTCAESGVFFSHRRGTLFGEPDYGRLLSAIALGNG